MKIKQITVVTLSLLMTQLAYAVSFTVINKAKKNILILPERSKPEDYEILKADETMKLSATFHGIKTLRWAEKPETNSLWNIYTATINLPLSPFTYNRIAIGPKGMYIDELRESTIPGKTTHLEQANYKFWPQRINEGIFTN